MAYIIQRKNSKYWQARFIDSTGKTVYKSTKETKRSEAQRVANIMEDVGSNELKMSQLKTAMAQLRRRIIGNDAPLLTLRQHSKNWLAMKKGEIRDSTYIAYTADIGAFLTFVGAKAEKDINSIVKTDIISFRTDILETRSPKTANRKIKILRTMFTQAEEEGLLLENPTRFMKMLKSNTSLKTERRAFTMKELELVLEVAEGEWKSMIMVAFYTGQRLHDVTTMQWNQIDLEKKVVHFLTGKTKKRLHLPINEHLMTFLQNQPSPIRKDCYLHPNLNVLVDNSQGRTSTVSNQFTKLLEKAGLRSKTNHQKNKNGRGVLREIHPLSFHSLRHTSVTALHEAGIPPASVEQFVGHDSTAVNRIYTHIGENALRVAANALPKLMA